MHYKGQVFCGGFTLMKNDDEPCRQEFEARVSRVMYACVEPGNATRYELVLADVTGLRVEGTGGDDQWILVSRTNGIVHWTYAFPARCRITPHVLEEASGMGMPDCEALAPVLEGLLNDPGWERS